MIMSEQTRLYDKSSYGHVTLPSRSSSYRVICVVDSTSSFTLGLVPFLSSPLVCDLIS